MNKKKLELRPWLMLAALLMSGLAQAASPEETVNAYMKSLKEGGVQTTADFIHPAELKRFKDMLMPFFTSAPEADRQEGLDMLFGKGTSLAQVEAMTPHIFMKTFMTAIGEKLQDVKFNSVEILGSVPEGELRHVVTRITVDGPGGFRMAQMEVVTTKPYESGWKLALTGQLEGLAEAMKRR
jgi:hypothetical protein